MNISLKTKAYIVAMFSAAMILMLSLIANYSSRLDWKALLFWGALAVITESLAIQLPNGVGVSVSFAMSLASVIIGGPLMAAVVSCVGFLLRVLKVHGKGYTHLLNTPAYKTLFNTSQSIVLSGVTGLVYVYSSGGIGKFMLFPTLLSLVVYILLNTIFISILFSLISKQSYISIWINNIRGTIPSSVAVGTLGIIIALAYINFDYVAVCLLFGPLLLARFSFKLYVDMRNVYMETIQALNKSMEAKDAYTSGHSGRVQEYAVKLAQSAGLSEKRIQNIRTAAILHDIGKIGVNDSILKKPGKLTAEEYMEIQKHPQIGAEILKNVDFLKDIVEIIKWHHERFDGKGYPDGLKGDQIPIEAMILSIADVYDAMTSERPYRKPLDVTIALREIELNAGTQFHPELAKKFVEVMSGHKSLSEETLLNVR